MVISEGKGDEREDGTPLERDDATEEKVDSLGTNDEIGLLHFLLLLEALSKRRCNSDRTAPTTAELLGGELVDFNSVQPVPRNFKRP